MYLCQSMCLLSLFLLGARVICLTLYSFCYLLCAPRLLSRLCLFVLFVSFVQFLLCSFIFCALIPANKHKYSDPRRVSIHNISVQLFYSARFDFGRIISCVVSVLHKVRYTIIRLSFFIDEYPVFVLHNSYNCGRIISLLTHKH